jgi:hypothetical protein
MFIGKLIKNITQCPVSKNNIVGIVRLISSGKTNFFNSFLVRN